jgi:hypothetical protein
VLVRHPGSGFQFTENPRVDGSIPSLATIYLVEFIGKNTGMRQGAPA